MARHAVSPGQDRLPSAAVDSDSSDAFSLLGPNGSPYEHSTPLSSHARSSSYHSALHEQDHQQQPQQQQQQSTYASSSRSAYHPQTQRRSGSLGNLFGPSIEFEIEIEKRPPHQPEQPTTVALDQASRATVTTSKDGRVTIHNVTARPGNTVVINSDFHSSDRSLNRSSGYFSSDELRSQGLTTNYSSDEQSSGAGMAANAQGHASSHQRRYKNNEHPASKLPSHYRGKQNHYQQLNTDNFDRVNQIVHRYYRQSNPVPSNGATAGFNEAIDQIDALYNNLDIHTNEDYFHDRLLPQPAGETASAYDFSKPPVTTTNRRKQHSQNADEYAKRYSSTGFQNLSSQNVSEGDDAHLRHLVSPPLLQTTDKRRFGTVDSHRASSDNENNANNLNEHNRNWGSASLTDLVMSTPIRPSQSLSSSGILADYATPGSTSPNSGFGSTQNVIVQQNRTNAQSQVVQRNRTSVKQVKQKSAAKKRFGTTQG